MAVSCKLTLAHNIVMETFSTSTTVSGCFDWQEVWYPIAYIKDLDKSQLTRFTLLEQDIVIWWYKKQSDWRVFLDQCPHRLVSLSEGRINNQGYLECPYHGWSFSGDGTCKSIPQKHPGSKLENSKRTCVKSFPTSVRQGLLFVYPGNPENAAMSKIPIIEPLELEPNSWVYLDTFRDLPYGALTLMENVLDSSHIPYTHHRTVGNRANVSPVELEVVDSGEWGFKGVWQEGPRQGTLGKQNTTFIAPGLMWHDLTSSKFGRTLTVVYATPIRKGECRLFARFPFKFSSKIPMILLKLTPRWYSHIKQNLILEDDQIFLHHQERYLEAQGGSSNFSKAFYLPTKADLFVLQLHTWVKEYSINPFAGKNLSPALPKEVLLDRYHSHTEKCRICRTALTNLKRARMGIAVVIVFIWALMPVLMSTRNIIPMIAYYYIFMIIGVVSWLYLVNLEKKFYRGEGKPPRNLKEN